MSRAFPLFLFAFSALTLHAGPIERLLTAKTGLVTLPPGVFDIREEIHLPDGARSLTILGDKTTLRAAPDFSGRALLSCRDCRDLTIRNLSFDGNRSALEKPLPLPPTDLPFARFYRNNGILVEDTTGLKLQRLAFVEIANYPVIVSHSSTILISNLTVKSSGSRNAKGRNNASGGILLEQGVEHFRVLDSEFANIRGNAIWTHSCYGSARNLDGEIVRNRFTEIGRDAIQVGHAQNVRVSGNTGRRIGFPAELVDVEGGGTPVGIDTAGNVDRTIYESNRFEEVNGKCIDLDGFHDGTVRNNTCINRGKPEDYAYGNFGISFNNTSIEMRSEKITIEGNHLEGMKFGGIFVVGSNHRIAHNTLIRLNTAHCNETHVKFGCIAIANEPGFLESGIYLAARADKPDPSRDITIEDNTITGWKMKQYCVRAAPGVSLADNRVRGNRCTDE